MKSITRFVEGPLKLKVNQEKSAVARPWKRIFLGFTFLKADRDWLLVGETGKTGNWTGKKRVPEAILRRECRLPRHGMLARSLNRAGVVDTRFPFNE